jgi:hypothetical protein
MKSRLVELSEFVAILLFGASLSGCSSSKSVSAKTSQDSTKGWGPTIATAAYPDFGVTITSAQEGTLFAIASINEATTGKIYVADSSGNVVRMLANGPLKPGSLRFRLLTGNLPYGPYQFTLEAEGKKWTQGFINKK